MNELESIRAFVKVAEVGSFTKAAEQLNVAKSAVTKRINQLEEHLELQLFQRSTRSLTITEGGTIFYQRCVHILSDLDQAKSDVSKMEWSLSGTFRVSCVSSFTQSYLADDLCVFQRQHPELQIDLHQHDRYCDPVQEGFDLSLQPAIRHSPTLEEVEITQFTRLIVGSRSYIEKYGAPANPQDLGEHRFAHNTHVQADLSMHFVGKDAPVTVPFSPTMTTNTILLLRSAVRSGEFLAMMPVFFLEEEIKTGEFVPILTDYKIPSLRLCAYYRKSSFVPMKARIFINFLKRRYGEYPIWQSRILDEKPELAYALGAEKKQNQSS